jgi:transcriptional regulator with XRE-family HTH domain
MTNAATLTLGALLREVRTRKGESQERAAVAIGVSRNAYSAWEDDRVVPERDHLAAILRWADLEPEDVEALKRAIGETAVMRALAVDSSSTPGYPNPQAHAA